MEKDKEVSPKVWCFTTYFAEGFPYSVIRLLTSVYFTDIGLKERYIGYLNFLGIPWNLKFLWAPLLDIFGTKRLWMVILQFAISIILALVAVLNFLIIPSQNVEQMLFLSSSLFILLAFLSATNDIAIDGYFMEGLPNHADQAAYTGYRVFSYRMAVVVVRSGFVALVAAIGAMTTSDTIYAPWGWGFLAASLTMLLTTLFHLYRLPRIEKSRSKQNLMEVMKSFIEAFATYRNQKRFLLVIFFIIFYKVGDEILFSMVTPFMLRELAITKVQYSWISGIVGVICTIIGTSVGGLWIKRDGLKKTIWPLTLMMNLNIWAYIWLAWYKPDVKTDWGISLIAAVHGYEQLAAGLGSAVLTVFILRTCKPEYKASHYAIGSAIMSLFSTFFGGMGGVIVENIGYLNLFILAFFGSIPSMIMLFWVPLSHEGDRNYTNRN